MGQKPSKQPQVDPRHLAPQKLHCFNEVDLRKLRRLIKDRKLAPCCPGVDSESRELEECPICFLKYPSLNRAVCCHKPICTECFLQVKALKAGLCPMCPYCKADFSIYFHGPASAEQKLKSEAEDNEQALALERSRQGEQQRSSYTQTQQLPAVPCQALPLEQVSQTAPASLGKIPQQADSTGMDLWDFLPHDSFMAETIQSEGDLDEAMLMQGIPASLERPSHFTTGSSSIPAPHVSCHTCCVPIPSQPHSDVHAAQQASRGSSCPALSPTESVKPRVFTGTVVGHSTGWQDPYADPSTDPSSSQARISGRDTAAVSHSTAASTSNDRSLMPPPSFLSDAIVHLSVKSAGTQPDPHGLTPFTASDVQSSSRVYPQLDKSTATSSGCIPSILPFSSAARKNGRVADGSGDTLAGFLVEQVQPPHVAPLAILPQSATHEVIVGMVTADLTFAPSAGQQHSSSSNQTETQQKARQRATTRLGCPPSTTASSSVAGSLGVSGMCSGCTAADCKQEQQGAGKAVPMSMEVSMGDLTDGVIMLQNPDGSVQYVVLTSDEQRAVQLSMQAKRNKEAGTAETSSYQVECSPEDQAVQAAIAEGDAILRRLYEAPQGVQQHPVGACSASLNTPDTADRSTFVQDADPMLKRMEEADAKLQVLYNNSSK